MTEKAVSAPTSESAAPSATREPAAQRRPSIVGRVWARLGSALGSRHTRTRTRTRTQARVSGGTDEDAIARAAGGGGALSPPSYVDGTEKASRAPGGVHAAPASDRSRNLKAPTPTAAFARTTEEGTTPCCACRAHADGSGPDLSAEPTNKAAASGPPPSVQSAGDDAFTRADARPPSSSPERARPHAQHYRTQGQQQRANRTPDSHSNMHGDRTAPPPRQDQGPSAHSGVPINGVIGNGLVSGYNMSFPLDGVNANGGVAWSDARGNVVQIGGCGRVGGGQNIFYVDERGNVFGGHGGGGDDVNVNVNGGGTTIRDYRSGSAANRTRTASPNVFFSSEPFTHTGRGAHADTTGRASSFFSAGDSDSEAEADFARGRFRNVRVSGVTYQVGGVGNVGSTVVYR